MAYDNDRVSVIEQFLSTRRRIRELERKALAKISTPIPGGPLCSFCGNAEEEAQFLIQGVGEARICAGCIAQTQDMLKGASGEQS